MSDILFSTIERYQEGKPWGRVLDAGTGVNSMKWMLGLDCIDWLGITADARMKASVVREAKLAADEASKVVVGNWMDEAFCSSLGKFDTIVADYLFGSIDGFSPHTQDLVLKKMKQHLNPGGTLYIIGMYPIPDHADGSAEIITEIRRVRDACILLAGHRPYRELPSEWIIRHLQKEGFEVRKTRNFSILHSKDSAVRQIRVARSKLELMENGAVRGGMQLYLDDLEARVEEAVDDTESGNIPLSHDYVIAADLSDGSEKEQPNMETVFTNDA
jgi:SAM-dependent methyltransferase